jgi:hypothetical protein
MRGADQTQDTLFSYGSLEERIAQDHPLRHIRAMADQALKAMNPEFDAIYSTFGRPSIPPEQLLRAMIIVLTLEFVFDSFVVYVCAGLCGRFEFKIAQFGCAEYVLGLVCSKVRACLRC